MDIHHLRCDSKNFSCSLYLRHATNGQSSARHAEVAYVPIGHRDTFEGVPLFGPQGAYPSCVEFAIVRMGPECDDAELFTVTTLADDCTGCQGEDHTDCQKWGKKGVIHWTH